MNILYILIGGSLIFNFFMFVIILMGRAGLKQSLFLFFLKKRGYGLAYEMRADRSVKPHVVKFEKNKSGEIQIQNRSWSIDPKDILLNRSDLVNCVVLTSNGTSINPDKGISDISPQKLKKLLDEAENLGMVDNSNEVEKLVKAGLVLSGITLLAIIFIGYVLYGMSSGGAVL